MSISNLGESWKTKTDQQKKIFATIIFFMLVAIIILVVSLFTAFRKNKSIPEYKEKIAALDSLIAERNKSIALKESLIQEQENKIDQVEQANTELSKTYQQNLDKLKTINHKYEIIPSRVHALSNDSLAIAIESFR